VFRWRIVLVGFWPAMLLAMALVGPKAVAQCSPLAYWLSDADSYWDGGTVCFTVTDSAGCSIDGCFDNRGVVRRPGAMWLGGKHPTVEGARLATTEEEARVTEILKFAVHKKWAELDLNDQERIPYVLAQYPKLGTASWGLIRELVSRQSGRYWQTFSLFRFR
jgi:hypothetical protein